MFSEGIVTMRLRDTASNYYKGRLEFAEYDYQKTLQLVNALGGQRIDKKHPVHGIEAASYIGLGKLRRDSDPAGAASHLQVAETFLPFVTNSASADLFLPTICRNGAGENSVL